MLIYKPDGVLLCRYYFSDLFLPVVCDSVRLLLDSQQMFYLGSG